MYLLLLEEGFVQYPDISKNSFPVCFINDPAPSIDNKRSLIIMTSFRAIISYSNTFPLSVIELGQRCQVARWHGYDSPVSAKV